ncbi:MAG: DUF2064 domain-containing protein [Deltaproteobacteria bacterium]|nr:DUF2064 domain-containing protein [Deltaproteobacteria bacterium]
MKDKNALIVIAKYPEKGQVMTRLAGDMTDGKRLELYLILLHQTLERLVSVHNTDTFIAFAPDTAGGYFSRFQLNLLPLPEGDLGKRMLHAFREVFIRGYKKAALVGVDIPELSPAVVEDAFTALSDNDVVFGPAEDGGYYLIGMKKPFDGLFEGIPWSSAVTLEKSVKKAKEAGCTVAFTVKLSDIDTIDDVRRTGISP